MFLFTFDTIISQIERFICILSKLKDSKFLKPKQMNTTFTHSHLLQYLYGELDPHFSLLLEKELIQNDELRAEYSKLLDAYNILNSAKYIPNASIVNDVLHTANTAAA